MKNFVQIYNFFEYKILKKRFFLKKNLLPLREFSI
jgi:hypothetical protein